MSFKKDLHDKQIPMKISRRDNSVLSQDYHHHDGSGSARVAENRQKADMDDISDVSEQFLDKNEETNNRTY